MAKFYGEMRNNTVDFSEMNKNLLKKSRNILKADKNTLSISNYLAKKR